MKIPQQKRGICRFLARSIVFFGYVIATFALVNGAFVLAAGQQPTAEAGKQVFEKRCTGCHSLDRAKEGPPLAGVFGRKAGSVAGFSYSANLKASGITWDEANLERWLTAPEMLVPDTDMSFQVANPQERAAIIAYLKSLE